MISFNPLWKTLIDKNMNKTKLQEKLKCSCSTITKMGKNEYIALEIIDKICKELNCRIEEVIQFIDENRES